MFDDDTPLDVLVARERGLNAEYGPVTPVFWFMYDNHSFAQLKGSAEEMGKQALRHMEKDKFCGSVFVRLAPNGQEIRALCVHGDYKSPENTRRRLKEWEHHVRTLMGEDGRCLSCGQLLPKSASI